MGESACFSGRLEKIRSDKEGTGMFTLFFRGMILYAVMILVMRELGKRQLGQFQP